MPSPRQHISSTICPRRDSIGFWICCNLWRPHLNQILCLLYVTCSGKTGNKSERLVSDIGINILYPIRHFISTLVVMWYKINTCSVFAPLWRILRAACVKHGSMPARSFEHKGRRCNVTTHVLVTCHIPTQPSNQPWLEGKFWLTFSYITCTSYNSMSLMNWK